MGEGKEREKRQLRQELRINTDDIYTNYKYRTVEETIYITKSRYSGTKEQHKTQVEITTRSLY